ncbi:MAG TPA: SDR family oxidoreductase [Luteibacter sp.]|nr:SDR family oxidoreductase [Luteibacter sp.]
MTQKSSKPLALITGASAGIGAVYARRLAARGYDLILVARRGDRLSALATELRGQFGVDVGTLVADLTRDEDVTAVENRLRNAPGLTLLVNNAGSAKLAPLEATASQDVADMISLNVTALTRLTQAVLPRFKAAGEGAIVNVASVLSIHSLGISAVYSGTKGYVLNFSRGVQAELEGTGVYLQLVLPASTETELWDLSGVPLAALKAGTVMTAENMVDAAMVGFDRREPVTLPSLTEHALWETYDEARMGAFAATQTAEPAARYRRS